tara:strand:+ start:5507 stop:6496 length:990 start_codon:yes stop_codon:yes gene_type:complete
MPRVLLFMFVSFFLQNEAFATYKISNEKEPFFEIPWGFYLFLANRIENTTFLGKESIVIGLSQDENDAVVDSIVANSKAFNPAGRPIRSALVTQRYANGSVKSQSVIFGASKTVFMGSASFDEGEVIKGWKSHQYTGNHLNKDFVRNTKIRELQWNVENSANVLTTRIEGHYKGGYKKFHIWISPVQRRTNMLLPAPNDDQWIVGLREANIPLTGLAHYSCIIDFTDTWHITASKCFHEILQNGDTSIDPTSNENISKYISSYSIADLIEYAPRSPKLGATAVHSPVRLTVPEPIQADLFLRGLPREKVKELYFYSTDGLFEESLNEVY